MEPGEGIFLSKEQKTGFVLLLVFGILVVGLGFLQMRNNIFNPVAPDGPIHLAQDRDPLLDAINREQALDTDQDGLNDYEEATLYGTSKYLPDTDSDGINDREEIEAGTDPNCKEGTACDISEEEQKILKNEAEIIVPPGSGTSAFDVLGEGELVAPDEVVKQQEETLKKLMEDPGEIRKLLLESGQVTEAQLELIPDETLLELLEGLLGKNSGVNLNTGAAVGNESASNQ